MKNAILVAALAAATVAAPALAQSAAAQSAAAPSAISPSAAPATLVLTATSEVQATPDLATIGAGVVTNAPDAAAALADNSTRMNRMLEALQKAGVASRDIQTSGLNVRPQYRYQQDEAPVLTGFEAVNRVEVRLRDVKRVGAVVDALVAAGGNQIDGPSFTVAEPAPLLDRARVQALQEAQRRATLYAQAAGLKVARIRSIAEGAGVRPPAPMARMMSVAVADAAPVAAGEVELSASVTVEFELAPN